MPTISDGPGADEHPSHITTLAALRALDDAFRAEVISTGDDRAGDTAILRMPLGRYVDAHGREIVLGEVLAEVQLDRDAILDWLSGLSGSADSRCVRVLSVRQELTDVGREAARALQSLLSSVPGEDR